MPRNEPITQPRSHPRSWPGQGRSRGERVLAALWIVILAASVVWSVRHAWVADDIYITFRYCDNVLAGHGPVYNPGERSEGYTHFLWFVLLTMGRGFGIEPQLLGKYLGIPALVGILWLLVHLSARLFPGRGGLWGVPIAALGWAVHEDARLFASGGLETSFFTFMLLLGFTLVCTSSHPRRHVHAAWAYGVATLLRPEALLHSGLAAAFVFWSSGWDWRRARDFLLVWAALVAPAFAFRLLYYGHPFPNPYYAKSGGLANWPQGLVYFRTYFGSYFVLALSALALWPIVLGLRRGAAAGSRAAVAPAFALAYVSSALSIFYVTRVGGDFMFARFFLPTTPFLLLLCEWLNHHLGRRAWRVAGGLALAGLVAYGVVRKHSQFSDKRHVWGIVDEPQYYPDQRLEEIRGMAAALEACLAGTDAVVLVQGGQASLAYYAKFPVAIERYGLTDEHIAHTPTPPIRGRPGHEKLADAQYVYDRKVNLRIHYRPVRSLHLHVLLGIQGPYEMIHGEIIVYDRELMEHLKRCRGIRFLDFPLWLEKEYIPSIPARLPARVAKDFNGFKHFYFDHNPDPEGLFEKLRREMARHGVQEIPEEPLRPDHFQDTGRPTMTGP
ncbi:MAG: hypothetical protein ACE5G2_00095 [Candidatus Krumholzibacteriia bacterium]